MRGGIQIIKETFQNFFDDYALRLSAALAYYAIFSLGPILVIVVGVAGMVFEQGRVREELLAQVSGLVGRDGAEFVGKLLTPEKATHGIVTTVLGVAALLVGATGLFGQLQDALNTIWEVKPKSGGGIWGMLKDRFVSFTMVLGIGFLLLISMILSTGIELASKTLGDLLPLPEFAFRLLHYSISFGLVMLLFAMIFKILPDVTVHWRDVWIGAFGTAVLFVIGKFLISLYLARAGAASAFGAAGALVIVLLWVYYASAILFLGAEFTQVYAAKRGSRIVPIAQARRVTEAERANEGLNPGMASTAAVATARTEEAQARAGIQSSTPRQADQVHLGTVVMAAAVLVGNWFIKRKITRWLRRSAPSMRT